MTTTSEIKTLIDERQLSQWHLMIASLLASLANQEGIFNQAYLNRILKHSMSQFIIPYFQTIPEYQNALIAIEQGTSMKEKIKPVIQFMDKIFNLAGQIEIQEIDPTHSVIKIGSSGCRFCPIGVGKAKITPGNTFCPFPTMIEETANEMLSKVQIKTVLERHGTKTKILTKQDGSCFIKYIVS